MNQYLSLVLAIIFETVATSFLKQSEQFTKLLPSIITVIGYAITFYFLSKATQSIPLGLVYAIWSGCGILLITIVGMVVFKQSLDMPAYLGLFLIIVGVVVINVFSKAISH